MRYKAAFIAGAVVGYVLGTRAGRERYEHLKKSAQRVIEHPTGQQAAVSFRIQAGELVATAKDRAGEVPLTCRAKGRRKLPGPRLPPPAGGETPRAPAPSPEA